MSDLSQTLLFQVNFYRFKQIIWKGVDWLFPPVCAGCGKARQRFCSDCIRAISIPDPKWCVFCGEFLKSGFQAHSCPRQSHIDRALVWGLHSGPLRKALHQFKYRRDLGLADTFAQYLVSIFTAAQIEVDMVVPVPLGRKRYQERGYNQAALLASAFSGRLGIRYLPGASKRIRETKSQVGLDIGQRRENVAGAFWADARLVSGKSILLIDDVLTTGATLDSCAKALKLASAAQVITLTLARAP